VQEKSKTNNYLLVIIANARYYAQLLRNRPVESDSTGNRTYYETLKISLVLEPSSPEQSARVDTLVVDSATRPFIPRATLPLDRSTARPSPFASKRPVASFVRVRRLFTTKRYISFPQTIDIFFPHKGTIYLFLIFSRAALFRGTAAPFPPSFQLVSLPRKNASANSTTRWVFRREKHPLIKSKETPHLIVFFGVFFCSYFLQNACVFSVVFSLASFPKSLKGLLRAFGGRRFRGVLFLFLVVVPSAPFFTPSSREQKTSGTTQSALDALSYSAFLIDWNFSTQHTFCN